MRGAESAPGACLSCEAATDGDRVCRACSGGRIGHVLRARWQLVGVLGAGASGTVFAARHARLGGRFALKLLHPRLAGRRGALARFEREARVIARLRSPHIVTIADFDATEAGTPFIVMERLVGRDLGAALASGGPLSLSAAAAVIAQACRGLAAAHAIGVVHRDVKPENLFCCDDGGGQPLVKVLDFGMAKLGHDADALTARGALLGTPHYISPEQVRGETVTARADVYALGVILFELLTGRRPFDGGNVNALLFQAATRRPPSLRVLRPDLAPEVCELVDRSISVDPVERAADAGTLAAAIASLVGDDPGGAEWFPRRPALSATG